MFWIFFALFLTSSFVAAATGGLFPPGQWYQTLRKPSWTPPGWVFPLVWTTLYVSMSYAAALVATSGADVDAIALALGFWTLQILLNALWSPVFFGLRRMRLALFIIMALWGAVAAALLLHWRVDHIAGLLFLPYLVWVSIAMALNATVLSLNKDAQA